MAVTRAKNDGADINPASIDFVRSVTCQGVARQNRYLTEKAKHWRLAGRVGTVLLEVWRHESQRRLRLLWRDGRGLNGKMKEDMRIRVLRSSYGDGRPSIDGTMNIIAVFVRS